MEFEFKARRKQQLRHRSMRYGRTHRKDQSISKKVSQEVAGSKKGEKRFMDAAAGLCARSQRRMHARVCGDARAGRSSCAASFCR
eukprot:6195929-Pleurochrysis_carterae.AAC.1